jgi:undecaprenyl-diphosphatase
MYSLDTSIFYFLFNFGHKLGVDWLFVFFASYLPYLIVIAFLYALYKKEGMREKIYLFGFMTLSVILSRGIITETIRYFFPRTRPFIALGLTPMLIDRAASFPSGHATFFFALAFCTFLINKKWGWILTIASILTTVSRVVAGVHWPSDIVGSAIIAGLVFAVMYYWILPPKKIQLLKDKQETLLPSE